jgi:hypothetical protein
MQAMKTAHYSSTKNWRPIVHHDIVTALIELLITIKDRNR